MWVNWILQQRQINHMAASHFISACGWDEDNLLKWARERFRKEIWNVVNRGDGARQARLNISQTADVLEFSSHHHHGFPDNGPKKKIWKLKKIQRMKCLRMGRLVGDHRNPTGTVIATSYQLPSHFCIPDKVAGEFITLQSDVIQPPNTAGTQTTIM